MIDHFGREVNEIRGRTRAPDGFMRFSKNRGANIMSSDAYKGKVSSRA